jgi:hypothetical protein
MFDVLYVPRLAKNLFLVKQLDKVGGEIRIKSKISILIKILGQTIIWYKLNPNLYELDVTIILSQRVLAILAIMNLNKVDILGLQ